MTQFFGIWFAALAIFVFVRWTVATINERARDRIEGRLVGGAERGEVHEVHND